MVADRWLALQPTDGIGRVVCNHSIDYQGIRCFQNGHSVATDPCGAFSEHGYAGTARGEVKDIAQFIKQTH